MTNIDLYPYTTTAVVSAQCTNTSWDFKKTET